MKRLPIAVLPMLLLCAAPAFAQMGMSNPPAMTAATLAKSPSGTNVTFVLRIDKVDRATASGAVLDPISGSTYHMSGTTLSLHVPTDVTVVMGSRDDVKPGAVVFVYGVTTKAKSADATKLVVITPYVKMQ